MRDQEQFDAFVRAGLAQFGIPVDEVDLAVMRAAEAIYGPERDRLLAADLSDIEPELGLDPSQPPPDYRDSSAGSGA